MKNFTLKQTLLFTAFILLGINANLRGQTVVPIGAGSTYKTIQSAYDAIKDGAVSTPITGAYVLELQTDYDPTAGTTLETFPITLNAINGASATNTITIRPKDGVKVTLSYPNQTIIATGLSYSSSTTSLVLPDITGLAIGSYVSGPNTVYSTTFKQLTGVVAGSGTTGTVTFPAGTFQSTKSGQSALFGAAQTKTIILDGAKYVIIDGVSRTDANTGLTIANPNSIYAQTIHLMGGAQYNTIKNCIIRGANQTSAFGPGVGATIFFNTTDHNTITLNDVCDMGDVTKPMPIAAFQVTASGNNTYNTISENNIYNVENYICSGAANTGFIQCGSGGASGYNNILNNKMYWTRAANFYSGTTVAAIGTGGSMSAPGNRFEGNTIGYANADGTGTATLNGAGVVFKGVSAFRNFTCKNNIIANIDVTGASFTGIEFGTSGSSTASDDACNGNTVHDIKLTLSATGTLSGITVNAANNYDSNIKNNIVRNLTVESATATFACSVVGINVTGAAAAKTYNYSGNQIYSLTAGNSTSTAANIATGLSIGANAMTVEKNIIYNITTLNTTATTTAVVTGIQTAGGNATGTVLKNNVVRLGTDVSNDAIIYGINQGTVTAATNILKTYHNSVFIGGIAPASATKNTFAFYSSGATAVTGTNDVKNNIFANQRINTSGTTAKHYAIGFTTASVLKTCDKNLYWANSIGLAVGVDKPLLSNWQGAVVSGSDAASYASDPLLVDPTNATTPNLRLNSASSNANVNGFNLASTVADDYLGYNRADFSPHDMGAYAYADNSALPTLDVATAVTAITTTSASSGGNITLDGGSAITARGICWNAAAIPTVSNNPTTDGTGTGAFTSNITGLIANTVYNLRSYATNSTGTAYSPNITFTTLPGTPTSTAGSTITATGFKANWSAPTQGSATFTYTLEYSTVSDLSLGVNTVVALTSTNSTLSGLTPSTTYYYRVKAVNASGSGAYSGIQTVTTLTATIVEVTTAQNASALTLNANTILNVQNGGSLTIDNPATLYGLNIYGGGAVTLNDTKSLTVANFTINSDANGTGTFLDLIAASGSLTVSGTLTVNQVLGSARNWYISSPVSGATASTSYTYYKRDESTNAWTTVKRYTPLSVATGYIANGSTDLSFTGGPLKGGSFNTGNISVFLNRTASLLSTQKPGFNLIGNPYPSYVDVTTVLSNTNLEPSYWLRSYNGGYVFDTYNVPGGIGTQLSGKTVSLKIAPMQAFWVRVKNTSTSATVSFSNAMRAHRDDANNTFRVRSESTTTHPVLRLQVSNGKTFDEAVVYANANASNDFDEYDSQKMSNGSVSIPEIYTLAGTEQLTINGLNAIPYDTEMPIGFSTGTSGTFSLKASQIASFDAGTQIILKDYSDVNNVVIADLSQGNAYNFSSDITSNNTSRFTLTFKAPSVATGNPSTIANALNVSVYRNANNQIVINYDGLFNSESVVSVYNALGQKLVTRQLKSTVTVLDYLPGSGAYTIQVSGSGKTVTKKMIID